MRVRPLVVLVWSAARVACCRRGRRSCLSAEASGARRGRHVDGAPLELGLRECRVAVGGDGCILVVPCGGGR